MEIRIRETGEIVSEQQSREVIHGDKSLPLVLDKATLDGQGADAVLAAPEPPLTQYQSASRNGAVQDSLGNWVYAWTVRDWSEEEIAAAQGAAQAALIANITTATQERLDAFAKTRGYDGILSACTYATSGVPKFAAEAAYCVNARDMTWAALYTLMAEVQAGTHAMPSGYADIEPELPVLEWPV